LLKYDFFTNRKITVGLNVGSFLGTFFCNTSGHTGCRATSFVRRCLTPHKRVAPHNAMACTKKMVVGIAQWFAKTVVVGPFSMELACVHT
jgi:hypothetical protein